jgi:hypothetical protein
LKISFAPVHAGYTVTAALKRMLAFFQGQFYGSIDQLTGTYLNILLLTARCSLLK